MQKTPRVFLYKYNAMSSNISKGTTVYSPPPHTSHVSAEKMPAIGISANFK